MFSNQSKILQKHVTKDNLENSQILEIKQHPFNSWIKEEIMNKIRQYFKTESKWKHSTANVKDTSKAMFLREIYGVKY